MEPWSKGTLDLHHIATGRGNSVLAILPDGTSMMIDAGAVGGSTEALGPARPNDSRRPGEWIGRYALHHLRTAPRQELDYFVLTHFHGDHMGDVTTDSPMARSGDYRLTGVSDVAELIPIRRLIDRGSPNYSYPAPSTADSMLNYMKFGRSISARGTIVEQIDVGSQDQIRLTHAPSEYPSVAIRALAANGKVWTGHGSDSVGMFPPLATLKPSEFPTENACSCALRMEYGDFRYYIGGDLTSDTNFGASPWMDVETAVAKVAGPVNVCALDHHGYYDATGPEFIRHMHPRISIIQTWHASHPALSVLNELYSPVLSEGPRDVFATGIVSAASLADARLSDKMLSQHGHIVVRVHPGGKNYEVLVLDDTVENGSLLSKWGPFQS
ncbi:beta-lactamase domain protein [Granulicella sibirica]|uniref:Beta-lactamase domain protein n=2 Tax=Granulicella sibirica TaxID=2479048 RepID=A0A4Q0T9B4_9BACT|nr:beta-lactamase domain protein [Granulicella sibirica]